jgi:hypothetical protein
MCVFADNSATICERAILDFVKLREYVALLILVKVILLSEGLQFKS